MEVIAIHHKIEEESRPAFLEKLSRAVARKPDVVLGPDYALNNSDLEIVTKQDRVAIIEKLALLSTDYPDTLIVPGTFSTEAGNFMAHICPVFLSGAETCLFKETDRGESQLAKMFGLSYRRGDCSKNFLDFQGKKVAVQICSDARTQRMLRRNPDLELNLVYDSKAGLHLGLRETPGKRIVVCDGFRPGSEAYDFDEARTPKAINIKGRQVDKDLMLYNLGDLK